MIVNGYKERGGGRMQLDANGKLVFEIKNQQPVELTDLTSALSSLAKEFAAFAYSADSNLDGVYRSETRLVRDRARVEVDGSFTTSVGVGNEIRIRNVSPRPLILVHWELLDRSRNPLCRQESPIAIADSIAGTTIAPASEHALTFSDQNYFSTSPPALNGRSLYVRLWFAGRRPIWRRVYPF